MAVLLLVQALALVIGLQAEHTTSVLTAALNADDNRQVDGLAPVLLDGLNCMEGEPCQVPHVYDARTNELTCNVRDCAMLADATGTLLLATALVRGTIIPTTTSTTHTDAEGCGERLVVGRRHNTAHMAAVRCHGVGPGGVGA